MHILIIIFDWHFKSRTKSTFANSYGTEKDGVSIQKQTSSVVITWFCFGHFFRRFITPGNPGYLHRPILRGLPCSSTCFCILEAVKSLQYIQRNQGQMRGVSPSPGRRGLPEGEGETWDERCMGLYYQRQR
jgi:hypothetical protein